MLRVNKKLNHQRQKSGSSVRVFRYLKNHKIAVFLALVVLICGVGCYLILPLFTSQIVDIGIAQQGIEHVATDRLSNNSHATIKALIPEEDDALFADSYVQEEDGTWRLTDFGAANRNKLDDALSLPLVVVHGSFTIGENPVSVEQMILAYEAGNVSRAQIKQYMQKLSSDLSANNAGVANQSQLAISAAMKEYASLGVDVSEMQMAYLLRVGLIMLGLSLLSCIFNCTQSYIAAKTSATVGRDLRRALFSRVVSFSAGEIAQFSAASLITRGTNDVQLIQNVTYMIIRMVLYAPVVAIGGIIMVLFTNASLGWIVIVAVCVVAAIMAVLFKFAMPKFKMMQPLIDRVNLVAREMLTGMPIIRAFARHTYEQERFDAASLKLMKTQLFTNRVMTFMMPTMILILNLTSVAIVWFGGQYIQAGLIQTGDMIAFISYASVIIMGFLMIGMISIMLPRADVAAERVNEVLDQIPTVVDPEVPKRIASTQKGAHIEFKDVSFKYPDSEEYVLEHVSFEAKPGQTLAIIGATGSGKSTVLKLLLRFYDVTEGEVRINGEDVRLLSQHDVREVFGYVPQKAFLFSGTIDTNVAYADEGMEESRVTAALDTAQAAEFVNEKSDGTDSPISQGGTNVSGGQRQRLCIARAVAKDPQAFLFDDSYSALDYRTDANVRHAFAHDYPHTSQIIVAQRIASIKEADTIVVLEEGHVVGQGAHQELMKTCEEYQRIARSQLSDAELAMGGAA